MNVSRRLRRMPIGLGLAGLAVVPAGMLRGGLAGPRLAGLLAMLRVACGRGLRVAPPVPSAMALPMLLAVVVPAIGPGVVLAGPVAVPVLAFVVPIVVAGPPMLRPTIGMPAIVAVLPALMTIAAVMPALAMRAIMAIVAIVAAPLVPGCMVPAATAGPVPGVTPAVMRRMAPSTRALARFDRWPRPRRETRRGRRDHRARRGLDVRRRRQRRGLGERRAGEVQTEQHGCDERANGLHDDPSIAGCPARIRTSINRVRVCSLTIRRQGTGATRDKPAPNGCQRAAPRALPPRLRWPSLAPRQRRRFRRDLRTDMQQMAQEAAGTSPRPPSSAGQRFAPPAPRHDPRRTYAALDLGTNNCRLLIARPTGDGFVIVDAFSRIVRLGEGLLASGRLSDAAIERAVIALGVCAEKLKRRHVTLVRSVATEACRRAENGREFVARVRAETGIRLDIIPPAEEARLAVLGCHALIEPGEGPALVFDIGGGSTELALVETRAGADPHILSWISAPIGVVSLTESEPDARAEGVDHLAVYARMVERARDAFAAFAAALPRPAAARRLMGTSGTVTTLASLHLGLPAYDRRAVDGLIVPADAMRAVSARLSRIGVAERATIPCIGTERADLVVAGCAILEAILDIWPAERLGIADRGIREGILRSLMAQDAGR